jgi:hypothetical protein
VKRTGQPIFILLSGKQLFPDYAKKIIAAVKLS